MPRTEPKIVAWASHGVNANPNVSTTINLRIMFLLLLFLPHQPSKRGRGRPRRTGSAQDGLAPVSNSFSVTVADWGQRRTGGPRAESANAEHNTADSDI